MRRPLIAGVAGLAAAVAVVGVVWRAASPGGPPPTTAEEGLYRTHCADCHGIDGRGSLRATLFLLRPGDLTDDSRMRPYSDRFLFDLIKHGGAPIGRPGMPGFDYLLGDAEIEALVRYVRGLSGSSRS